MKISLGQLVICRKGKEKGRLMCVTGADEKYVYLADGRERPLGKPKRKNPKHVELTDKNISNMFPLTDKALRKILLSEV